jgi:4-hydroxyphenylpyruvate dioxygenase
MARSETLGIKGIEGIHYYVHELPRSRRFYVDCLDFVELGGSSAELEATAKQRSLAFQAGGAVVICSAPAGEGGRAARYLAKHPDGIGTILFQVHDVERAFRLLEARGGTPITDVTSFEGERGKILTFSITTPFGDTTFRFVERRGTTPLYPGFEPQTGPSGAANRFGLSHFDHVTANFQTMKPALLWMEHVMGFEAYWNVEFHTRDVAMRQDEGGSGLRSVVMWDPESGVKFAHNEPYRPHFKRSQINVFNEEHRGDGVQHVAIAVGDIVAAVAGMRARGVEFLATPAAYYDRLPQRLVDSGIGEIDEEIARLAELQILVDGAERHRYLLQIFLKDAAELYHSREAGPFFYELIQRKGDPGFGEGNFRALFESIERGQQVQTQAPGA